MPRASWGFVHLFTAVVLCTAGAKADETLSVDLSASLSGGFAGVIETQTIIEPLAYSPCTTCGTPTTYRTNEYNQAWQLDKVNAAFAYARGATGAGIIIGVVDTGVDLRNRDLDGNVIKTSLWAQKPWSGSTSWHGTAVSGVIAAEKNNSGIHGVAYQSRFLPYQGLGEVGIGRVLDWRSGTQLVRVVNNSWGLTNTGNTLYSPSDFTFMVPILDKAVRNDAVIVFSAGNDGQTHPQAYARAGYYAGRLDPTLYPNAPLYEGLVLAAVATDKNNVIASWSNRCGMAMYDCLAAPGVGVISTTIGGSLVSVSGTSFSAPIISGAIAVIMDIWPGLAAKDVVQILKTTATDLGAVGVDPIYGWGLVNLDKATQPIGSLTITGGSLSGSTLSSTSLSGGGAMGAGFSRKLSGLSFTTYDDFNRDYDVALSALASGQDDDLRMARMMERFTTPLQMTQTLALGDSFITANAFQPTLSETEAATALHLSLGQLSLALATSADAWQMSEGAALAAVDPALLAEAHLGLIDDATRMEGSYAFSLSPDWSLALGSQIAFGDNGPYSDGSETYGGEVSLGLVAKDGHASITLGFGSLHESEGFLGTTGEDLTALGAGDTNYMSLGGTITLTDGLALAGQVSLGESQVVGASGSLVTAGSAYSLGWSASLLGQSGAFAWGLGVAQPLRVESGHLDLILPVQDDSGAIVDETARVDLTPSGREMVGQAWLSLPLVALGVEELGSDATVKAGLVYRHQPDHDASKDGEAIGMMSLGFRF